MAGCDRTPERPTKRVGFALILTGVIGIVWGAGGTIGSRQNVGHALFLGSALLWACYTVAMRHARLDGLHAAAIAAVGALLLYIPVYAFRAGASLLQASSSDIALQALVQGLLTAVIASSLRTRGQYPGRLEWCRIRCSVPRHDRTPGHSAPRRMAHGN